MGHFVTNFLKQVKHRSFLLRKKAAALWLEMRYLTIRFLAPLRYGLCGPFFKASDYPRSFLSRPVEGLEERQVTGVPRRVFVVWTSDNELTENRLRSLQVLRERVGVPVELITPKNLEDYVRGDHPLHPAYRDLSLTARSDYLRAYLLHYYGGGYADIKEPVGSWKDAFDRFEVDEEAWVASYPEIGPGAVALRRGTLGHVMKWSYHKLVGCGAMILRANTPFSKDWLDEAERRLDYHSRDLAQHPGGVRDEVPGYPLMWGELCGEIYQPLQLKYLDHVRQDSELLLSFEDYR